MTASWKYLGNQVYKSFKNSFNRRIFRKSWQRKLLGPGSECRRHVRQWEFSPETETVWNSQRDNFGIINNFQLQASAWERRSRWTRSIWSSASCTPSHDDASNGCHSSSASRRPRKNPTSTCLWCSFTSQSDRTKPCTSRRRRCCSCCRTNPSNSANSAEFVECNFSDRGKLVGTFRRVNIELFPFIQIFENQITNSDVPIPIPLPANNRAAKVVGDNGLSTPATPRGFIAKQSLEWFRYWREFATK